MPRRRACRRGRRSVSTPSGIAAISATTSTTCCSIPAHSSRCSPTTAIGGATSSTTTTSCRCSRSSTSIAEAWASLASEAGAGYSVLVTKHHDGWAWWDAPGTDATAHRTRTASATCSPSTPPHASDTTSRSAPTTRCSTGATSATRTRRYVDEVLHPQVIDLVERHGSVMLWGDGHWAHDAGDWKTSELLDRVREHRSRRSSSTIAGARRRSDVPDGAPSIVRTFEYDAPDDIVDGTVGAHPRHRPQLRLQPGRAGRTPSHRLRDRRAVHRGRRQGRPPADQRRPGRRRHDPRDASGSAA